MANLKDYATGTVSVAPSPALSGTTLTLQPGEGSRMPDPPFYANAHPDNQLPTLDNAEKIYVTAKSTDTITFTRAQGSTTAKSIAVGWRISNALYKDDLFNSSIVQNEVPGGTINGTNTAFTVASAFTTGSLEVYLNGLRQKITDDYTVSGTTITFVTAPPSGSNLLVDYMVGNQANSVGTNSYIAKEAVTGSINGTNAVFTTARAYIAGSLEVYVNGLKQGTAHVTETTPSSGTFTLDTAPVTGDVVEVAYQYNLNPSGNADTVDGIHASTTATANHLYPLNSSGKVPNDAVGFSGAVATRTSAQSIASATFSQVAFDAELYDTNNYHSTTSNTTRLTAPYTGYYAISYTAAMVSAAGGSERSFWMAVNGGGGGGGHRYGVTSFGPNVINARSGYAEIPMNAGDYVELWCYQDSGAAINTASEGASKLGPMRMNIRYLGA